MNIVAQYEVIEYRDNKIYSIDKISIVNENDKYFVGNCNSCESETLQGCIDKYIMTLQETYVDSSYSYRRI